MELKTLSDYPFLKEVRDVIVDKGISISDIIESDDYAIVRSRGVQRVVSSLIETEVQCLKLVTEKEYLFEILSYAYARLLVSAIGDTYLINKYALGEAVRVEKITCRASKSIIVSLFEELEIKHKDNLDIFFTDYLKYTSRIKEQEWKLVNREVCCGYVKLPIPKISRLIQNAVQDRINSELPLNLSDDMISSVKKDTEEIEKILSEKRKTFATNIVGDVKTSAFPPCIANIINQAMAGVNLPHSGRFAMVSFLNNAGMKKEDIISIFAKSPDFDERRTSYQVRQICDKGYKCPECATIKMNGQCVENDICKCLSPKHPLYIYERNKDNVDKLNEK